ncbi:MAG: PilN domain-containing protein [bacterium]
MIKINLLAKSKKNLSAGRELIIGIACLAVLFGVGSFWYYELACSIKGIQRQIDETKRQLETSHAKVKKINELKEEKKDLEKKLSLIRDLKSKQKGPAPILNQISLVIPDEIWLSSLSTRGKQMTMEGRSLTANNVAEFMKCLESSRSLSQIELGQTELESMGDKKVQKFKITCNLTDPNSQVKQQGGEVQKR